jgi:hypothetical protein
MGRKVSRRRPRCRGGRGSRKIFRSRISPRGSGTKRASSPQILAVLLELGDRELEQEGGWVGTRFRSAVW